MQFHKIKYFSVLVCFQLWGVFGSPSEYWAHASSAVRRARDHLIGQGDSHGTTVRSGLKLRRQDEPSADSEDPFLCGAGENRENASGSMWWTAKHCSTASRNLTYVYKDSAGNLQVRTVEKGTLIKMKCENWECPIPPVPNCYLERDVCIQGKEWCMVETHEKWGAWAMGAAGNTPDFEHCGDEYFWRIGNASQQLGLEASQLQDLHESRDAICQSSTIGVASGYDLVDGLAGTNGYKTWMPSRGKCVRFRQEGESCIPTETATGPFNHTFIRRVQKKSGEYALGGSLDRPLACAPGLVCTGADFDVLPSTCVQARPQDLCYAGPWWNSTECPRTNRTAPRRGLDFDLAKRALQVALLLYPGEVQAPSNCSFWEDQHVEAVRRSGYSIFKALWPEKHIGSYPTYKDVEEGFTIHGVNLLSMNMTECKQATEVEQDDQSDFAQALATAGMWAMKPNLVWSLIHFVMHNQPQPMSHRAVDASRALASHLSENFWCNDCRGFFTIGVLSEYGLPPSETDGEAHARYWNFGHNVASEHVATTRGGHPWINDLASAQDAGISNPFFVPYETSVAMWRIEEEDEFL